MTRQTKRLFAARPQIIAAVERIASVLSSPPWFPQLVPKFKADGTKLTPLDPKIERELIQETRQILSPDSWHVIGEEGTAGSKPKVIQPYTIICDPIDGTALASSGLLSLVGVNLAFLGENREPLLGIIHFPQRASLRKGKIGVTYVASATGKTWRFNCNGDSVAIQKLNSEKPYYLHVSSYPHRTLNLASFKGKLRAWGATGTALALLADGGDDPAAVCLTRYKIWDCAAGLMLCESRGCRLFDLRTRRKVSLKNILTKAERDRPLLVIGAQCSPPIVEHLKETVRLTE